MYQYKAHINRKVSSCSFHYAEIFGPNQNIWWKFVLRSENCCTIFWNVFIWNGVWLIVEIISIPDEELFSETAVGCTASYFVKIIWCSCWFCTPPPLFWGWILLILWSPKSGCCSILDDLSCPYNFLGLITVLCSQMWQPSIMIGKESGVSKWSIFPS